MNKHHTIVIGAGHAGLAASYLLKQNKVDHVVLERGRVGETWRTQRWASFKQNTPNLCNVLPGDVYDGNDREGFDTQDDFVRYLEGYVRRQALPVQEGCEVMALEAGDDAGRFKLTVRSKGATSTFTCDRVVLANGGQRKPRVPEAAKKIDANIRQIHSSDYRTPADLPAGAVLVVGGAQSGCQIADELVEAGRKVYLASSRVGRAIRRYRGKDCVEWLILCGFMDQHKSTLPDPRMALIATPQVSGAGPHGRTVSYQQLHRDGATILGRFSGWDNGQFTFADDAAANVRFADELSAKVKGMIDGYIQQRGLDAPPAVIDPADAPDPEARCISMDTRIDPRAAGITSVVWCTGFVPDLDWVKLPVLDEAGQPKHEEGASSVPGIYFLGYPWMRRRASGNIYGVRADAEHIVARMIAQPMPA